MIITHYALCVSRVMYYAHRFNLFTCNCLAIEFQDAEYRIDIIIFIVVVLLFTDLITEDLHLTVGSVNWISILGILEGIKLDVHW